MSAGGAVDRVAPMSKDTLLATALRVLRESRSYTQKELAELSDIERNTISKYENGWIQPSREKLRVLLDALGLGYGELEAAEAFVRRMRVAAAGAEVAADLPPVPGGGRSQQIRQVSEQLGRNLGTLLELVTAPSSEGAAPEED